MSITTAADLAAGQIAMVGRARFTLQEQAVVQKLFNKITLGPGEKSHYIPKFGAVTANDLTDGVDMTDSQSLVITGTVHTTDEAGCKVIITKKLRAQLKEDAYRAAGTVIGNAMVKKIEQDGLTLFSGLNSGIGVAAATFSIDVLRAMVAQCMGQSEPCPDPIYGVFHPYVYDEVMNDIATPGTNNMPPVLQDKALMRYFRGVDKIWGVPIFTSSFITPNALDDAYGAVFSKQAFVYLVGWEPENWVEEDKSLRGWEIGIVADYSMVEEDGGYGRYSLHDATAPVA